MSNATLRVVTALVAAPVVVGAAYAGGWLFGALLLGIALLAQRELYGMASAAGLQPRLGIGGALGALLLLTPLVSFALPAFVVLAVGVITLCPFLFARERLISNLASTLLGAFYPVAMLGYLLRLRLAPADPVLGADGAFWLVLATIFIVWAADIFAYYTGRALGRHALAPAISPNKTWEGAAGGLLAAVLVAVAFKLTALSALAWGHVLVMAAIGGGIGQLGDLAESALKRASGINDSSAVLPGHGGLMDRFDAMATAAPLIYVYLTHIAGVTG